MEKAEFKSEHPVNRKKKRRNNHSLLPLLVSLSVFLFFFPINGLKAQPKVSDEESAPSNLYDQIPVEVIVTGFDNFTVDALYTKSKMLCVNIEDLFRSLKIPCKISADGNSITGFIVNESRTYTIDLTTEQIKTGTKTIKLKNGLIKEQGSYYLESSLFSDAFGITLTFNYRTLSMSLKSGFEFPVVTLARIEKMRKNMSKVKGEVPVDTIIHRNYHFFKAGTLDWSASSTQSWNMRTYNQLGVAIGTEFLYGEADVSINLYDQQKFNINQLNYIWRWIDNDKGIIKQALVGKLSTSSISFIGAPVIGASIRNTPTTVRKASGYYNINDRTEPNWTVELYINSVLVDYTTADASGNYVFKVPIVYGYTTLKLKFYGPLGEERMEERTMNVPYTVMSKNEFEYGVTGGMVQDSTLKRRYGNADFNYGVSRFLTIGGGVEYLSSIPNAPYIPFARMTLQPFSRLTMYAEYDHGVRASGLLNYYITKDALLEIDYTKYVEGQLATPFNALEERKVKLSFPLKINRVSGYAKLDYSQLVYKSLNYNLANAVISTYYNRLSASSTTQFTWTNPQAVYMSTNLTLSYRLNKGLTLRPSAQYILSDNRLMSYDMTIEKYIPKGNFSLAYRRDLLSNNHTVTFSFKYDLRFAKTNFATTYSSGQVYTSESAQGSLAFGSGKRNIHTSNNSSIGKGGISFYPFLDMNENGIFDVGEPMVKLNSLRISGGSARFSEKDSIVRVPDLNAFTYYTVELNNNELNNIAWRFKKNTYRILVDPNQFKRVDIPIQSLGEVSGMVYTNTNNTQKGIGRILVKLYKKDSKKAVAETLTESDGYIYFLGIEPGDYIARIDSEQLEVLNMVSLPAQLPVTIKRSVDGDIVDGIKFVMSPVNNHPASAEGHIEQPKLTKAVSPSNSTRKNEIKVNDYITFISKEGVVIQIGAFKTRSNAFKENKRLGRISGKPTLMVYEDKYYKVRMSGFATRTSAQQFAFKLSGLNFPIYYVPFVRHNFSIQIGDFMTRDEATDTAQKWSKLTGKHVILIVESNNRYKVRIQGLSGKKEAISVLKLLNINI